MAATVVATLTFHLRAIRWRILLLPVCGTLPFGSRYAAVCIGFMANNVLPARLGEFARAYSLSRIEPVPVSGAFASLVVERLLDAQNVIKNFSTALARSTDLESALYSLNSPNNSKTDIVVTTYFFIRLLWDSKKNPK